MSADRVAYWRARFMAMPGGHLPRLVAPLVAEIPGVPMPVPDPLPLAMVKMPTSWLATLSFSPDPISASGPSPADAIASLLAKIEMAFADPHG